MHVVTSDVKSQNFGLGLEALASALRFWPRLTSLIITNNTTNCTHVPAYVYCVSPLLADCLSHVYVQWWCDDLL